MPPPADAFDPPDAVRRLRRLRRKARRALAWELAAPLLWPPAAVAALFVALVGFGVLPLLPGWGHAAALTIFALAFLWALARGARRWRRPSDAETERRIETDSGVRHRPLAGLRDGVGDGDAAAAALWAVHRRRLAEAAARLTVKRARPDMAAADPWGLRQLAFLLLFVAVVGAGGGWRERFELALSPDFSATKLAAGGEGVIVEAWLAPPEATGMAPIFLSADSSADPASDPMVAPAGSRLTARVSGASAGAVGTPTLTVNRTDAPFAAVDERNYQIEATVLSGDVVVVSRRGRTLAQWPIRVVEDQPPEVDFAAPPSAGERGALRVDYLAADDYGLARVRLRVAPSADADGDFAAMAAVEEHPLGLPAQGAPGGRPRAARGAGIFDLTGHLWAGLPASLTLIAEDGGGQTAESRAFALTLPERRFSHPVARALVAERRRLTLEGERGRPAAAATVRDLAARPQDVRGDVAAYLGITAAAGRLTYDYGPRSLREAQAIMWETALRVEDGGASQAERALRQAQQALAEALERGASEAELQALMDRLQAAMDEWMEALERQMRQALADGETPEAPPPELMERLIDRDELQSMVDRMRQMAQTGARDAARQMLSQLQQMMDRMQTAPADAAAAQQRNQAFDLMRRLRELADRQQELMDETYRQARPTGEPESPAESRRRAARERADSRRGGKPAASPLMQQQAEKQEALRRSLGETMRQLGELNGDIPRTLGRAEREMRQAEGALRGGAPESALDPQGEAVEALRQGLQDFADQVMRQMAGAMAGAGQAQPGGASGRGGRDPLGRLQPQGTGGMDSESVKVPTEAELQRARDIQMELRRRAGEPDRPALEREYIDRLLRRF